MIQLGVRFGRVAACCGVVSLASAGDSVSVLCGAGVLDPGFPEDLGYLALLDSGDYDRDGNLDLLYANGAEGAAWVARGLDGGAFGLIGPISVPGFQWIAAGDLDGDGVIDLVSRAVGDSYVTVADTGDGQTHDEHVEGIRYNYSDGIAFFAALHRRGDLDGDGADEMVFNTTQGGVFVRWSSRSGEEMYERVEVPGLGAQTHLHDLMDYDGDGDLDVLLLDRGARRFAMLEGDGSGGVGAPRFLEPAYISMEFWRDEDAPLFGHLDQEPGVDLMVYDRDTKTTRVVLNFAGDAPEAVALPLAEGERPVAVVGDLDHSGVDDLVIASQPYLSRGETCWSAVLLRDPLSTDPAVVGGELGVMRQRTTLGGGSPPRSWTAWHPPVVDTDLDGDADADLIWFGPVYPGHLARTTENRIGELIPGAPVIGATLIETPGSMRHLLPVDLDGDGVDELIATGYGNTRVYDIQAGEVEVLPESSGPFTSVMADLDGDGVREFVQPYGGSADMLIFPVNPDGTLGERVLFPNPDKEPFFAVVAADFDGDGNEDIAAIDDVARAVHVLRGVEGPGLSYWGRVTWESDTPVYMPAVLDFDQDGLPDLALGMRNDDEIALHRNNGDGTFTRSVSMPSPAPYWISAADLDLDGVTDLASVDYQSTLTLHYLDAGGAVSLTQALPGAYRLTEIAIEDVNADALPDIILADGAFTGGAAATVLVYTQSEPRAFELGAMLPSYNTSSVAVSDLNADGAADVITASSYSLSELRVHWGSPAPCPADLTGDGRVNFFDISAFLRRRPDWNGDGLFNFFDVSGFLQDFSLGCP